MKIEELKKAFSLAIEEFPDRARSHFTIVDPDNWWVIASDDPLVGVRSRSGKFEGPWHFTYENKSYTVYGSVPGFAGSIMLFFEDLGLSASEYAKKKKKDGRERSVSAKGPRSIQAPSKHDPKKARKSVVERKVRSAVSKMPGLIRIEELKKAFSLAIEEFPDRARSHFTIVDPDNWCVIASDDPLVGGRSRFGKFVGPWHFSYENKSYTVYGSDPGFAGSIMLFFEDLGLSVSEYAQKKGDGQERSVGTKDPRAPQSPSKRDSKKTGRGMVERKVRSAVLEIPRFRKIQDSKESKLWYPVVAIMLLLFLAVIFWPQPKAPVDEVCETEYQEKVKKNEQKVSAARNRKGEKEQNSPNMHIRDHAKAKLSENIKSPSSSKSLTQDWMTSVVEYIKVYKREMGQLPNDLKTLKEYVSTLRLRDEWGRKFEYDMLDGHWSLRSSGRDGRWNTDDDIVMSGY